MAELIHPVDNPTYLHDVAALSEHFESRYSRAVTIGVRDLAEDLSPAMTAQDDIWEAIRRSNAGTILQGTTRPDVEQDIFDSVQTSIFIDALGTNNTTGRDVANFAVGSDLPQVDLDTPESIAKAEATVRLLVEYGIYKLHQWENGSQYKLALSVMQDFTEKEQRFEPDRAGFPAALTLTAGSLALLALDDKTSNLQVTKPERDYVKATFQKGLGTLATIKAVTALRNPSVRGHIKAFVAFDRKRDVTLAKNPSEQAEHLLRHLDTLPKLTITK